MSILSGPERPTQRDVHYKVDGRVAVLPAGHAAALLSDALYIVGGGNNSAGCADLMSLDLGGLATGQPLAWSSVAKAEPRSAIASEGASLSL